MGFSILWGLNIAYSLATLFYQVTSFSQHPTYSLICILAVIVFSLDELTTRLAEGLLEAAEEANIPLVVNHVGGMFGIFFTDAESV
ncbi:hypothetical protein MJI12_26175, partial [Salmonella enterica subsp. enterica serovar Kentucky]|nr:hypothetical protein [Salmonella enterica subsp. enterica serovar Kentucky]